MYPPYYLLGVMVFAQSGAEDVATLSDAWWFTIKRDPNYR
jgi:hypothetical protein